MLDDPTQPSQVETLVLDPLPEREIKFCVHEYIGSPIYRVVDGTMIKEPIVERDGIKVGDAVAGPSLWGYYFHATVKVGHDGDLYIESPHEQVGFLEFDGDTRHCWVCVGTANLRGLKNLKIQR